MGKNRRPVGYGFRPTEEELVNHYLHFKNIGHESKVEAIPVIDLCSFEPWDIPKLAVIKTDDPFWYFFSPNNLKYRSGNRRDRATESGFWKPTGKDRKINCLVKNVTVMKKSLGFYKGHARGGVRTDWKIHEYQATKKELDGTSSQGPFVLCRLFIKQSGEKAENSNYDETEPIGSSSTTTNPSPNGMQSALAVVPMSLESDMQVGKQVESTEKSHMTSGALESHCNSYMTSNMEDHEPGAFAQVDLQLEEDLRYFYVPRSPLQSDGTLSTIAPVQATLESDMQVRKQLEAFKWLLDNPDNMPSNTLPHVESHCNNYMASDMEDNKLEGTAVELREDLGAFVLCHQITKQSGEKTENSNCDEIEPTGSSSTTMNPSSNGTPSALAVVQMTLESDMQVGKQVESTEKSHMTSDTLESHCNSYMTSDMEDHEPEKAFAQADLQVEEALRYFYVPRSPLQSDGVTSTPALVQATLESDMQVRKRLEAFEKWLLDNSDDMPFNVLPPVEGHCNSYMASDMKDNKLEGTALEVRADLYDGTPSTQPLVQATLGSDMQVGKQWEGIEKLLVYNSDNMTSTAIPPVESHCYSYKASDMEDHEPEGTALEDDLEEWLRLVYVPTNGQLDDKVSSPLQYEMYTNQELPDMDSPFNDFGRTDWCNGY